MQIQKMSLAVLIFSGGFGEANIGEACKTTVKKYIVLHDTTNRQQYFAKTQVQNRPDNLEFKHDMFWSFNKRLKKFSRENREVSQSKSQKNSTLKQTQNFRFLLFCFLESTYSAVSILIASLIFLTNRKMITGSQKFKILHIVSETQCKKLECEDFLIFEF